MILFLNPNHFSFFFSVFQRTRKIIRCFLYPLIEQVRRIFQEIFRIFPFSSRLAVSRENFSGLANYERSVETSKRSNNLIFDFSIHTFSLTEMVPMVTDFLKFWEKNVIPYYYVQNTQFDEAERASITFSLFLIRNSIIKKWKQAARQIFPTNKLQITFS